MEFSDTSYLTFILNGETFAIHIAHVTEVLETRNIARIPQAPDFMKGIINLRGDVIPVVSLRLKLNMDEIEQSEEMVIMVLYSTINKKNMEVGAVADKVKEVIEILPSEIQPFPDITSTYSPEFVEGIYKHKNEFIVILNINSIIFSILPSRELNEKINI
jgi:purine-binding chemotaxis protein CheW